MAISLIDSGETWTPEWAIWALLGMGIGRGAEVADTGRQVRGRGRMFFRVVKSTWSQES